MICILALASSVSRAKSVSPRELLREGNTLYGDGKFADAVNKYNDALVEQPQAVEPKFNKANGYFRMDDLGEATDLYQEVATKSKDMGMVAKAKYNLGNCFFQRGAKQRDSDLQKAVDDMKTSIGYWRQVLDLDPKNEKAARNIEVARLTIKDILDQIKKQQEQQKDQQQDPNQPQQQQQKQSQQDPNQPQNSKQAQDPNQPQDPNQTRQGAQPQDPNQTKDQQKQSQPQQGQEKQPEQKIQQDATAQEIIDNEQRQKKDRQILQRGQYLPVEKDW